MHASLLSSSVGRPAALCVLSEMGALGAQVQAGQHDLSRRMSSGSSWPGELPSDAHASSSDNRVYSWAMPCVSVVTVLCLAACQPYQRTECAAACVYPMAIRFTHRHTPAVVCARPN